MGRWFGVLVSSLLVVSLVDIQVTQAKYVPPYDQSKEDLLRFLPTFPKAAEDLLYLDTQNSVVPLADEVLDYRLPNATIPLHYDVTLSTNVHTGDRAFNGTVIIDIKVVEATSTIVLHARQLSNFSASIKSADYAAAPDIKLVNSYNSTLEFLTLTPSDSGTSFAANSNWTLTINYNGTLRTDNGGFYLSTYRDEAGTVHYLATTQFESTNARHAFPCYDEPAKRANFSITLKHSPTYTAISNMPVNTEKSSPGITAFQTTPKMSSYLIAFIVSDFEYSEGALNNITQRVYSRKGTQKQQTWGLVSGLLVESSLSYYYDVPFALPKLDQAAIPDFAAGAMENWGLATYREEYMLYTRENSTVNSETNIANIIGHEYTHMWFGDLVSVKWWTWLWLKEGFATLFSYESNDIAYPEWNVYQIFHISDYNSALMNDAYTTATPMTHYVQTPNEISSRYNTFSYAKPASVLYMFKNAWTDKVFRSGLHKYLSKNKFNSCEELDLFAALQEAADEEKFPLPASVTQIFSSWSRKSGFPLLNVERFYENGTFKVTQHQFTNDKNYTSTKTWYVPFNFAVSWNPDFRNTTASHYLLDVPQIWVNDAKIADNEWLILNKQSTGYYRINYDERNWGLIAEGLRNKTHKIHPRNRAQLMLDAFRFMSTGRLSQSVLLNLMSYLKHEDQYAPWSVANSIFTVLDQYLRGDAEYHHFQVFVQELVDDIFDKVGVNEVSGEQHLVKYMRSTLINLACLVGSKNCYRQANVKLREWDQHGQRLEPNVKTQILCNGLREAGDVEFKSIFQRLLNSQDATERRLYISSLGCSQNPNQLQLFINSTIDTQNSLSSSERTSILSPVYSRGEVGLTESLNFLEANWEAYGKLGTGNSRPLDTALKSMAGYVVNDIQKERLLGLVKTVNNTVYVTTTLTSSVENSIQANFNWLKENRNPLMGWIVSYRSGSVTHSLSIFAILLTIFISTFKFF